MTNEQLKDACTAMHMPLDNEQMAMLHTYAQMLANWNEKMNLTAITEEEEVNEKHFLDSILPLGDVHVLGNICDVGSGAGFPGLVWKIVRPDLTVTLLEPTGKRCTFLQAVIDELHLNEIKVINKRAEDFAKEKRENFDVVTARAVANLSLLSELCLPLVRPDGLFIAMKGLHGDEEAIAAEHAITILGGRKEAEYKHELPSGERINLVYRKVKKTPVMYPRNYGQMKKKPL